MGSPPDGRIVRYPLPPDDSTFDEHGELPLQRPICRAFALLVLTFLLIINPALAQNEADDDSALRGLALSLGYFDLFYDGKAFEVGVEYRLRSFTLWKKVELTPAFGISLTEKDSTYVYSGLRYDWWMSERWVFTPHLSIGIYDKADGKDLGGPVELRTGVDLALRVGESSRFGLSYYHLSNSRIYENNPGIETVLLVWSFGR
jgi:lipid A 3-O-deacylase